MSLAPDVAFYFWGVRLFVIVVLVLNVIACFNRQNTKMIIWSVILTTLVAFTPSFITGYYDQRSYGLFLLKVATYSLATAAMVLYICKFRKK